MYKIKRLSDCAFLNLKMIIELFLLISIVSAICLGKQRNNTDDYLKTHRHRHHRHHHDDYEEYEYSHETYYGKNVYTKCRKSGMVALTFDDGVV